MLEVSIDKIKTTASTVEPVVFVNLKRIKIKRFLKNHLCAIGFVFYVIIEV